MLLVIKTQLLNEYQSGISIQLVHLQGVVPPQPVADSFNEVNRAKQEEETLVNEANQEYNKKIFVLEGEMGENLRKGQEQLKGFNLFEELLNKGRSRK